MRHSHKLFSLLALAFLIQVSFAMGGKPPKTSGSQSEEKRSEVHIKKYDNSTANLSDLDLRSGLDEKDIKALQFMDDTGKLIKEIPIVNKIEKIGGTEIKTTTNIKPSKNLQSIVVTTHQQDLNEKNMSKIMSSYSGAMVLYDKNGKALFERNLRGTESPWLISDDGKVVVLVKSGFDMIDFEKLEGDLNNLNLTQYEICAIDKRGQILFNRKVKATDSQSFKISPSGQWLCFKEIDVNVDGPWKITLIAIDITNKKEFAIETMEHPYTITDEGTVYLNIEQNKLEWSPSVHNQIIPSNE